LATAHNNPGGPADLRPDAAGWKGFTGFGTQTFRNSGDFVYNMLDEVHFRERGAHIPRAKIASKPGGRQVNWRDLQGPPGSKYDYSTGRYYMPTEGSVLTVGTSEGTKKYRSSSNRHRVESYVSGRTGLSTYSEDARVISEDVDLGEYFEAQRKEAEWEATKIVIGFVVDVVLVLYGPKLLNIAFKSLVIERGAIRFGLGRVATWQNEFLLRNRLALGGKGALSHVHVYPHNWFKPWTWATRSRYAKISPQAYEFYHKLNSNVQRIVLPALRRGISNMIDQ